MIKQTEYYYLDDEILKEIVLVDDTNNPIGQVSIIKRKPKEFTIQYSYNIVLQVGIIDEK